jgi:hypothetical protein
VTNELVSLVLPTIRLEEATMSTPFGPQLIGETEKTLNALLLQHLVGTGLTEPQWVTLRVAGAGTPDGAVGTHALITAVADRAHFRDASQLVGALTDRGLLLDGQLTDEGRDVVAGVQAAVASDVRVLFGDLGSDDVAATARVLNDVLDRARVLLGTSR